jgi:Zn-finger nucleic acid-binding protein
MAYRDLYITVADQSAAMPCPRCSSSESLQRVEQWQMSMCNTCVGLFVGFAQLEELMQSVDHPGDIEAFVLQDPVSAGRAALHCPRCSDAMQTTYFFRQLVDVCTVHGVWFDVGELTSAMERMKTLLGVLKLMSREPK